MELEHIVEALIFASPDGVSAREIARVLGSTAAAAARERMTEEETVVQTAQGDGAGEAENPVESAGAVDPLTAALVRYGDVTEEQITAVIVRLIRTYEESRRAFTLAERPTGWRIAARPEYAPWVRQLFPEKKPQRLTPSALETLAIIAYRQPVTKASIEAVRGVSVDGPMQTLLDRNIIRISGRADLPGRPLLYETTDLFLDHFGIKSVDELPNAAELRAVKLPEPEEAPHPENAVAMQQELPFGTGEDAEEKPKRGRRPKAAEPTNPEEAPVDASQPESDADPEAHAATMGAEGD